LVPRCEVRTTFVELPDDRTKNTKREVEARPKRGLTVPANVLVDPVARLRSWREGESVSASSGPLSQTRSRALAATGPTAAW
jgi:hypothetical protein